MQPPTVKKHGFAIETGIISPCWQKIYLIGIIKLDDLVLVISQPQSIAGFIQVFFGYHVDS